DVVHPRLSMDRGFRVRLAGDQHRALQHAAAQAFGYFRKGDALRPRGLLFLSQDPQAAPRLHGEHGPLLRLADVVAAISEEDEVPVAEPAQELLDLVQLGAMIGLLLRVALDHRDGVAESGEHRLEVVGRRDDVLESAVDLAADLLAARRIRDVGDLAVDEGAWTRLRWVRHLHDRTALVTDDPQHGIHVVLDRQVLAAQVLADGVDDERAVADLGANDRNGRAPPLLLRVEHLDVDLV